MNCLFFTGTLGILAQAKADGTLSPSSASQWNANEQARRLPLGQALLGTPSAPPELRQSETAWLGGELHGNTAKTVTCETLSDEVERLTGDSTLWSIAFRQRMSSTQRISNSAFPIQSRQ